MRGIFFNELKEAMKQDKGIFFLTGDTGFNLIEPLFEIAPERTINVGIAEQNLINVSAGLALEGFTVYSYAIAPFLTMRAYEQIRINLSLHALKLELEPAPPENK